MPQSFEPAPEIGEQPADLDALDASLRSAALTPDSIPLRLRVLDHPDDDLEPEVPARDRPERLQDVRPEGVELRGRVEVGDRRLAVEHPLALSHADVERAGQAVAADGGRALDRAVPVVDRQLLPAR